VIPETGGRERGGCKKKKDEAYSGSTAERKKLSEAILQNIKGEYSYRNSRWHGGKRGGHK